MAGTPPAVAAPCASPPSPAFSFSKPKVLFRQPSALPERMAYVSADGERFPSLPPPRGPQLQQITVFDRQGQIVQKVGEPGLYSPPSFSPDGKFMAFRSDEAKPERGEVYVRTFDASTGKPGEGKWQVSKDGVNALLHWRADGKEIFSAA